MQAPQCGAFGRAAITETDSERVIIGHGPRQQRGVRGPLRRIEFLGGRPIAEHVSAIAEVIQR